MLKPASVKHLFRYHTRTSKLTQLNKCDFSSYCYKYVGYILLYPQKALYEKINFFNYIALEIGVSSELMNHTLQEIMNL